VNKKEKVRTRLEALETEVKGSTGQGSSTNASQRRALFARGIPDDPSECEFSAKIRSHKKNGRKELTGLGGTTRYYREPSEHSSKRPG
jgi:hypothetical protein